MQKNPKIKIIFIIKTPNTARHSSSQPGEELELQSQYGLYRVRPWLKWQKYTKTNLTVKYSSLFTPRIMVFNSLKPVFLSVLRWRFFRAFTPLKTAEKGTQTSRQSSSKANILPAALCTVSPFQSCGLPTPEIVFAEESSARYSVFS